ncbi:hypothetical protein BBO99_00009494 [Phytophthora kernoviae]|uniref:Uncharacterized protein n=2 Tax=Phytophthora kernoviae TaxID=325452 RepID=A0A3R7NA00_9STRA|nr:hypothetical protein G195_003263 [Phytophthora kernoviae 00238/432]KAG2528935.1 hypothetical protein JM16_000972 [Phytophthora kernoviae]KAG2530237.1 hypothetical protein JM18_001053 [Phytophthora kernoviae]RLN44227.1 hypothetical protein BBI17_002993 [Phytophthora kernoviae]RLN73241.1 hypothetical protein BBO99_00009494 [Phytophthora kernoviae]
MLHQIRERCRDLARQPLDEKVAHIENMSDSAQMYKAVRDISRSGPQPLLLLDQEVSTTRSVLLSLAPITADEVETAFRRVNNGRASGPDDIPAELLKYGLAPHLAELINTSFE